MVVTAEQPPTPAEPTRYDVVVADDAPDLRFLLRLALERTSRFRVVAEAADGAQAVEAALAHRPHLTLLDLSMPVMDGLQALPLIRAGHPDSTIVVLSGFDVERMSGQALAEGADAYLAKGVAPDELVTQLLELLDKRAPTPVAQQVVVAELPESLEASRHARRLVEDVCGRWGLDETLDDVLLLTSELVTNAVVHAGSPAELTIRRLEAGVRVEVTDTGTGSLERREARLDATSGRGLFLVEALSAAWGTTVQGDRKVVRFER